MTKPHKCPNCQGRGRHQGLAYWQEHIDGGGEWVNECPSCAGVGVVWEPPEDPGMLQILVGMGQLVFWGTAMFWLIWTWS